MSIEAIDWALKHSEAEHGARLVHIALASHAGKTGRNCWPSHDTLAAETRMSARAVRNGLVALEKAGYITRAGKTRYGTVVWHLRLLAPAETASPEESAEQGGAGRQSATAPRQSATAGRQSATDSATEIGRQAVS
jgi:hypothetical protein